MRTPRRGRQLLVLPSAEEQRVFQVAEDFRAWPRVAESWRLDRFGGAGITAFITGEPGTGKTLAAEVIARWRAGVGHVELHRPGCRQQAGREDPRGLCATALRLG